jgi:hypothetical protein
MAKVKRTITVSVPITIEIDPQAWADEYGLSHLNTREIRRDIKTSITSMVQNIQVLYELGATVNGGHLSDQADDCPDVEHSTPTLITDNSCMTWLVTNRGKYLIKLDPMVTAALDQGTLSIRVLREPLPGAVFRIDGNGCWTQRQGPCEDPGHRTVVGGKLGGEFVDHCNIDPFTDPGHRTVMGGKLGGEFVDHCNIDMFTFGQPEYKTMILCPTCRERRTADPVI